MASGPNSDGTRASSATKHVAALSPQRLEPRAHAKPWGRHGLGAWGLGFASDGAAGDPIGEIHHGPACGGDPELLVKTLFTGDRLSVQVHPDTAFALAQGDRRGKDEAWVVLAAEPDARIGLGLSEPLDAVGLRAAALDGSIVDRLIWHHCAPGDVFFTPAGTIHAIGAGVTLFEVQQNNDVTYRLHDYGRDRELHLDAAIQVANGASWCRPAPIASPGQGRELLVEGPGFVLERVSIDGACTLSPVDGRPAWVAIVSGDGLLGSAAFATGEVWLAETATAITGVAEILIAYPGAGAVADLWRSA
jgi:mannose-6-phosphate isomerase